MTIAPAFPGAFGPREHGESRVTGLTVTLKPSSKIHALFATFFKFCFLLFLVTLGTLSHMFPRSLGAA